MPRPQNVPTGQPPKSVQASKVQTGQAPSGKPQSGQSRDKLHAQSNAAQRAKRLANVATRKPAAPEPTRAGSALRVRTKPDGAIEFIHPRAVLERREDLEEVREMIAAGEIEIAVDELRWLLGDCSEFIDAHRLLGEAAMVDSDWALARGHFGVAYQLGVKAVGASRSVLPYRLAANQSFHEAAKGLIWCLLQLDKRPIAEEVVERIVHLDPTDPLAVRKLLEAPSGEGCSGEPK